MAFSRRSDNRSKQGYQKNEINCGEASYKRLKQFPDHFAWTKYDGFLLNPITPFPEGEGGWRRSSCNVEKNLIRCHIGLKTISIRAKMKPNLLAPSHHSFFPFLLRESSRHLKITTSYFLLLRGRYN